MSWIDAASLCVFLCNIVFMVVAGVMLLKIQGAVQQSGTYFQNVLAENVKATAQLRLVCGQLATQLNPTEDDPHFRETAIGKAHTALSLQVRSLSNQIQGAVLGTADKPHPEAKLLNDELTERLREKLKAVMTKNLQLKQEIGRTNARLTTASNFSNEIHSGMAEVHGASPAVLTAMTQRTEALRSDLEEAQRRAQAAEKLAESNASKLEEMREALSAKSSGEGASESVQLEKLRSQKEMLAGREQSLLAQIDAMEMEFARNQTEKNFIEDRYVDLDMATQGGLMGAESPPAAH